MQAIAGRYTPAVLCAGMRAFSGKRGKTSGQARESREPKLNAGICALVPGAIQRAVAKFFSFNKTS